MNLKQTDHRWSDVRIGNSLCKLGRWGCTVLSLCMALGDLQNRFVSPANAARYWKFDRQGRILWKETAFNGMEFVKRYYRKDLDIIEEYANDPDKVVIIAVNNDSHWLYVRKSDQGDLTVVDPIDGQEYEGLPTGYWISGFATFNRTYERAPEWASELWAKAHAHGLLESDPLTPVTARKMENILFEMGIIQNREEEITLARWFVIMEKAYRALNGEE